MCRSESPSGRMEEGAFQSHQGFSPLPNHIQFIHVQKPPAGSRDPDGFPRRRGTEAEVTARRHGMFKIIPRINQGGWIVKQAVGQNTPVLLGKKLTTKYFRWASLQTPPLSSASLL